MIYIILAPLARHNFSGLPDTDHTIIRNDLTDTTRDFEIIDAATIREAEQSAENASNVPAFERTTSLQNHIANSFALGPNKNVDLSNGEINDAFSAGTNSNVFVRNTDNVDESVNAPIVENDTLETSAIERCEIRKQPRSWYKFLCTPGKYEIYVNRPESGET